MQYWMITYETHNFEQQNVHVTNVFKGNSLTKIVKENNLVVLNAEKVRRKDYNYWHTTPLGTRPMAYSGYEKSPSKL